MAGTWRLCPGQVHSGAGVPGNVHPWRRGAGSAEKGSLGGSLSGLSGTVIMEADVTWARGGGRRRGRENRIRASVKDAEGTASPHLGEPCLTNLVIWGQKSQEL